MHFLDADQIAQLAGAVPGRYRALILTAAYTGLRAGELAGLKVNDLDLPNARLSVIRTLTWVNGHAHECPPKTNAARRTVSLPPFLADLVRQHLSQYGWGQGYVFTSPGHKPIRWSNWRRRV
jgi:integrase